MLSKQTATAVITALKTIFARHGIPMQCMSDNGPCYASQEFKEFSCSYGFQHLTSSPRYAPANGEAERGVRIAKDMLRKSTDIQLALLSYRTTPLSNGFSPAQLLMGRQLRSTVPHAADQLTPHIVAYDTVQQRDAKQKNRQKAAHDKHHRAKAHTPFTPGQRVWVPDLHAEGRVVQALPYRAYQLRMLNGNIIRRNASSIRCALPARSQTSVKPPDSTTSPARAPVRAPSPQPPPSRSSGRLVKKPQRLDL